MTFWKTKNWTRFLIILMAFALILSSSLVGFADDDDDDDDDDDRNSSSYVGSRHHLTVVDYDVDHLDWGNGGAGWNANVAKWQNRDVIFDATKKQDPAYFTAKTFYGNSSQVVSDDYIFFYNQSHNKSPGNRGSDARTARQIYGYFVPNKTDHYKFKLETDDGFTMGMNLTGNTSDPFASNKLTTLLNRFTVSSNNQQESGWVKLYKNVKYPIYMEYFNWGGDGHLRVLYKRNNGNSNDRNFTTIPKERFYALDKQFFTDNDSTPAESYIRTEQVNDRIVTTAFDNFNGSSINSAIWNVEGGNWSISNKQLKQSSRGRLTLDFRFDEYDEITIETEIHPDGSKDGGFGFNREHKNSNQTESWWYTSLVNNNSARLSYQPHETTGSNQTTTYFSNHSDEPIRVKLFAQKRDDGFWNLRTRIYYLSDGVQAGNDDYVTAYGDRDYLSQIVMGSYFSGSSYYDNFKVVASKPADLSGKQVTGFTAQTHPNNPSQVFLQWDRFTGGTFDNYVIEVSKSGGAFEQIATPNANATTLSWNLTNHNEFTFRIRAVRGTTATDWSDVVYAPQNTVTLNYVSAETGESLGSKYANGPAGTSIQVPVAVTGYDLSNGLTSPLAVTMTNQRQSKHVMFREAAGGNLDKSTWPAKALQSIQSYAAASSIPWYSDHAYGDPADSKLLSDFLNILKNTGVLRVKDELADTYRQRILAEASIADLPALQALIDGINQQSHGLNGASITGFQATYNTATGQMELRWDALASNISFDHYAIHIADTSSASETFTVLVPKGTTSYSYGLAPAKDQHFAIRAQELPYVSNVSRTNWTLPDNAIVLRQVSGETGELLGTKTYFGSPDAIQVVSTSAIAIPNYVPRDMTGPVTLTFTNATQTINIMYREDTSSPPSAGVKATWPAKALASIQQYARESKVDWYEGTLYEVSLYKGDETTYAKKRYEDFLNILRKTGVNNVDEKGAEYYKATVEKKDQINDLSDLQDLVDFVNETYLSITPKNLKIENGVYVEVPSAEDDKVYYNTGLDRAMAFTIDNDQRGDMYHPFVKIVLDGNEYFSYTNPALELRMFTSEDRSTNKRISSTVAIQYNATENRYDISITPLSNELNGGKLPNGTYYVVLDTELKVHEDHTIKGLIQGDGQVTSIVRDGVSVPVSNDKDVSNFANDNPEINFPRIITQIQRQVNGNWISIMDGIKAEAAFNFYRTSDKSGEEVSVPSTAFKFKIKDKNQLPGSF